MNEYFYLDKNNQQQGPISPQQFYAYDVTAETLVWCSGMDNWTRAGNIRELQDFISKRSSNTTPPPPPHTHYAQQPYQGSPMQPCPDSHMVWAVLSTVCCCLPLGIVAIIYASKVQDLYMCGNYIGAVEASNKAKTWSIISAITGFITSGIYSIIVLAAS